MPGHGVQLHEAGAEASGHCESALVVIQHVHAVAPGRVGCLQPAEDALHVLRRAEVVLDDDGIDAVGVQQPDLALRDLELLLRRLTLQVNHAEQDGAGSDAVEECGAFGHLGVFSFRVELAVLGMVVEILNSIEDE